MAELPNIDFSYQNANYSYPEFQFPVPEQYFFNQQFEHIQQQQQYQSYYGLFQYHEPVSPTPQQISQNNNSLNCYEQQQQNFNPHNQITTTDQQQYPLGFYAPLPTPPISPTRCQKCGYLAETVAHLVEHGCQNNCGQKPGSTAAAKDEEPKPTRSKMFCCQFCPKTFFGAGFLRRHLKVHINLMSTANKKPALTTTPNYVFEADSQTLVLQTEPTEIESKPSTCLVCNRVFSGPCYLLQHNNVYHKGVKSHRCKKCGKMFAQERDLTYHTRKHDDGDKPNKCFLCSKSYHYKCDLKRHVANVHDSSKENYFWCSVCPKGFIRKDHLNKHFKTHAKY